MCFLSSAEGQNKDFCKRVLKAATRQNDEAKSDQSSGTDEKDVLHLQIDGFFDWDGGGGGGIRARTTNEHLQCNPTAAAEEP